MKWGGGGLFPPHEALKLWKQHPPIVTGLELGGDGNGCRYGVVKGGGVCQTGSSCIGVGPPSVVGGGVD